MHCVATEEKRLVNDMNLTKLDRMKPRIVGGYLQNTGLDLEGDQHERPDTCYMLEIQVEGDSCNREDTILVWDVSVGSEYASMSWRVSGR